MFEPPLELSTQILEQKHPDYEVEAEQYERRRLLYVGGEEIRHPDNAKRFIPDTGMMPEAYKQKLGCATYTNSFAKHTNLFVSQMMTKDLAVQLEDGATPPSFVPDLLSCADRNGNSYRSVLRELMAEQMVHGETLVGVDIPSADTTIINRADEAPLKPYLYLIPKPAMTDWSIDDCGNFEWCKLRSSYQQPASPFDKKVGTITDWRIWTVQEGRAWCSLYRLESRTNRVPNSGVAKLVMHQPVSFTRIPILHDRIAQGLNLGSLIGTKCADHFRMTTSLVYAQERSLYAMPYYQQGEPPKEANSFDQNDNRWEANALQFTSRGFARLAANDKIGFAEPSGSCYELVHQEQKDMLDDIARTVNQMAHSVAASTHGTSRSAASKMADNDATEIVLSELGESAKDLTKRILDIVADGMATPDLKWELRGLCNYEVTDQTQVLTEATAMAHIVSSIPSEEFHRLYIAKVALALLHNLTPESEDLIRTEIDDAIKNGALASMTHAAEDEGEETNNKEQSEGPQETGSRATKS